MKVDMQARPFLLTNALPNHLNRRPGFALCAGTDQVQRIKVHLSDTNDAIAAVDGTSG